MEFPTYRELDEIVRFDSCVCIVEKLVELKYFDSFTQDQIYELFSTACGYNCVDIVKVLYFLNLDYKTLNPLMINFMAEVGEYNLFRWIYEQDNIIFTENEIIDCFYNIIKSGNLEFLEWFYKLQESNLDKNIINKIEEFIYKNKINLEIKNWLILNLQEL